MRRQKGNYRGARAALLLLGDDLLVYIVTFSVPAERARVRELCRGVRARIPYMGDERMVVPAGISCAALRPLFSHWRAAALKHLTFCCTPSCGSLAGDDPCMLLASLTALRSLHVVQSVASNFTCFTYMPRQATTLRLSFHDDYAMLPAIVAELISCADHVRHLQIDSLRDIDRSLPWTYPITLPHTMATIGRALLDPAWCGLQSVSLPVLTWDDSAALLLRTLVQRGVRSLRFGLCTPAQGLSDMSFLLPPSPEAAAALPNRTLHSLTMTYGGVCDLHPLPSAFAALQSLDLQHTYENCLKDRTDWHALFPTVRLRLPMLRR